MQPIEATPFYPEFPIADLESALDNQPYVLLIEGMNWVLVHHSPEEFRACGSDWTYNCWLFDANNEDGPYDSLFANGLNLQTVLSSAAELVRSGKAVKHLQTTARYAREDALV